MKSDTVVVVVVVERAVVVEVVHGVVVVVVVVVSVVAGVLESLYAQQHSQLLLYERPETHPLCVVSATDEHAREEEAEDEVCVHSEYSCVCGCVVIPVLVLPREASESSESARVRRLFRLFFFFFFSSV